MALNYPVIWKGFRLEILFFLNFLLPDWKEDGTDTILVEKEGTFSAFIPMEHTTFYLLTHQPKVGEPLRSCIRGAEIIARVGDDIKLKGSLDYLGAVRHSGGFYDNSLVARYDSLTASSNTEMIDIFSQILKYQDTKQMIVWQNTGKCIMNIIVR